MKEIEKEKLQTIDLTSGTLANFMSCFENNGEPKNERIVQWQFIKGPINKQYVSMALDPNKNVTAAIYAIFPVAIKVGDAVEIGSQSLDTITDENYRGKGLFIKLANDVYKKATADNVSLVYGFPNGNSINGFSKKLDWKVLDPVPFLLKPLNSRYFTSKISFLNFLPNIRLNFSKYKNTSEYSIIEQNNFPSEIDVIWKKFSNKFKVAVQRDVAYLNWRYLQKPMEEYKILHCYNANKEFLGFVIFTVKNKHGGRIGYIMELIYDEQKPDVGKNLLENAVQRIKNLDADCILSWCMAHSPNYNVYKKNGFFNLPEKLRPIELHFGVRAFNDNVKSIVEDRNNWYLSYSDSDTV